MADEKKKEETTKKEKKELFTKRQAMVVGRVMLGLGLGAGIGMMTYSLGKSHGSDSAYEYVYKTFPEIRERLSEIDPAFFASIVVS